MHDKPIAAGKSSYDLMDQEAVFAALELKPDTVLLDLASGVGNYALAAAERLGGQGKVYAFDLWREGIEALQQEIAGRGLTNIEAGVADAGKAVPLTDSSVDTCLVATALHDLAEVGAAEAALAEIARVLKPGGRLAVIEFKKMAGPPGPPEHIRLSPQELDDLVQPRGFAQAKSIEVSPYNYVTVYFSTKGA